MFNLTHFQVNYIHRYGIRERGGDIIANIYQNNVQFDQLGELKFSEALFG